MEIGRISIRYAKALLAYAIEKGEEKLVYEQMEVMAQMLMANADLQRMLATPTLDSTQKEKLLTLAAGKEICATMKQFIRFAIDKKKETMMLFIAMSYRDLYHKEKDIVLAKLTSATKLEKSELDSIQTIIKKNYGEKDVQLTVEQDDSLIAGFVLGIDNVKLDASVAGELKKVRRKMGIQ